MLKVYHTFTFLLNNRKPFQFSCMNVENGMYNRRGYESTVFVKDLQMKKETNLRQYF